MALEWAVVADPTPPAKCGVYRGRRSLVRCELPPDHMVGRLPGTPVHEPWHLGRGRAGRWYSWAPEVAS